MFITVVEGALRPPMTAAQLSIQPAILMFMQFSGISVLKAPDVLGRPAVAVILSSDMKFTTAEGDSLPGAALQPKQAKLLAYRILAVAAEIEAEAS